MTKSTTAVDVIIPTYNGMPYLQQTVESVLKQTHKNLVLYVIDDGSTDDGATKKYVTSLEDKRVVYKRKSNGGQATARNFGIGLSNSPYVALIDSDDIWRADKLEKQLELFEANPRVGLVYGLCKLIDEHDNIFSEVVWKKRGNLFKYLLGGNKISGSASMVMIKREVFDKYGLFHEDFLIGEDWEMWLRIAKYYEIDYVPDYIASLRVRSDGMQQNHLKMARGLEYMLPIMTREFHLNLADRAALGKTCLKEACLLYFAGKDKSAARRTFFKALWYNPLTFATRNYHVWFLYARIILGNEWLRNFRRRFSPSYRRKVAATEEEEARLAQKHPKVSVLLPAYNAADYLAEAIDSILAQSFRDFELIIVNDGSTDTTQKIIDSYSDERIICLKQPNQGIVSALNNAFAAAKGTYIARQDADDLSEPQRLQTQLELLHKHHEVVLVGSPAIKINARGKKVGTIKFAHSDAELRSLLFSVNPFVHGSVMIKSSVLRNIGAYQSSSWPAEDYDLWLRLMLVGQAMNTAQALYRFRDNQAGISRSNQDLQTVKVLEVRKKIFARGGRLLNSPFILRRALQVSGDRQLQKNMKALVMSSLKHGRPRGVLMGSLNLICAIGAQKQAGSGHV